ncbi:hypothetical protein [Flavobacterium sp. I3-2]|uniref:hypothetical protein n=1 Tax=Flavobacterium sp. I3-2 TaxID=2748319 RepID=UPI0015AE8992|nr:hypothetical protein [Flavobacterium sp. I3-2]
MVTSKFSNTAYFYSILVISFPVISAYLVRKVLSFTNGDYNWQIILFLIFAVLLILAVVIWGFFVEMNIRMAKFVLNEEKIVMKQLLGIGTQRQHNWKDLQGFVIRDFKVRGQHQEHLYLIKNNKSVAVMSSLYMKNYMEVRTEIMKHLQLLN